MPPPSDPHCCMHAKPTPRGTAPLPPSGGEGGLESKGSRSVCLAKLFFGGLGAKANKPPTFKKQVFCWPCRLRRQGPKTTMFLKTCGCLAWVPQASQKPLGQNTTSGFLLFKGEHFVATLHYRCRCNGFAIGLQVGAGGTQWQGPAS